MKNSLKNALLPIFLLYLLFGIISSSHAEPYMAIRGGYKCGQCHINRTGGGMRTGFGLIYSQTVLPHKFLKLSRTGAFFDGKASEKITFGANLRVNNKTVFGVDRPKGTSRYDNSIDIPEGNIYLKLNLINNFLSFYVDETILPTGARNREAFALIHNLPFNSYLKAGRMLLPFGMRILDDNSFIRQRTGYNYANQDIGIEFGLEPGPISLSVAITNGTQGASENNIDKQISAVGSVLFSHFRIGGSYSLNRTPGVPRDLFTTMYGGFAGLYFGRFALVEEADIIRRRKEQERPDEKAEREKFGNQLVIYSSLNVLLCKGVNFRIAYDYYDPRLEWDEDQQTRLTIGPELFPVQFLQFKAYYRLLEGIPQKPQDNENQLIFELQAFF